MMQLDFKKIHEEYNKIIPITGIIHVGACTGEERDIYLDCGVPRVEWFEANPETFSLLKENISQEKYKGHVAHELLLADTDDEEVTFFITSNFRSASSSMLPLGKHKEHYPKITVQNELRLKTKKFETYAKQAGFNFDQINFLNMDVQGAELKVLKGFGDLLNHFDYVYSEVNTAHLYEGCVLLDELDQYLSDFGFIRREIHMTPFEWGDALYVRKTVFT